MLIEEINTFETLAPNALKAAEVKCTMLFQVGDFRRRGYLVSLGLLEIN